MSGHIAPALLQDYVDGEASASAAADVEAHLGACAACRAEERTLRALLGELAGLGGGIAPERDLLPELAARIDRIEAARTRGAWLRAAAILALVVGALAAVAVRRAQTPPQRAAPVAGAVVETEAEYARAAAELETVLSERRDALPPGTSDLLDAALAAVDAALAEARTALLADPGNPVLARLLVSGYEKKLDVLRHATEFSSL